MTPNRRKFLIGSAGLSTGLALPIIASGTDRQAVDLLSADYLRYVAFLSHERKQAWIDLETLNLIRRGVDPDAASRIISERIAMNNWPMGWTPTEFPTVTALCASPDERPADRAQRILKGVGL